MKRILMVLLLVSCFTGAAFAASDVTVSGTATSMNHFIYPFSSAAGDVSVTADFSPQNNKGYTLILYRDGSLICRSDTAFPGWAHPVLAETTMTCADPGGPGGSYVAEFYPTKGTSVDFTLTVSTP